MRHISFLILVTLVICCNQINPVEESLHAEKGIILSCVRCGCMEKLLEEYVTKYGFSVLPVYTDTNCLERSSVLKNSIHLSQSKLDSLYQENYNIILFKKKLGKIEYRVINTDELLLFKKTREEFFEE